MKTLLTRALSAIAAVILLFLFFDFFRIDGLKLLCLFAVLIGAAELTKILFFDESSKTVRIAFYVLSVMVFVVSALLPEYAAVSFAALSILFCILALIFQDRFEDLESLSEYQAKGIMGFFYIGLLPAFAYRLLVLPNGLYWFISLLAIVFAGDTLAYVFGSLWGKTKIMPKISPKKTLEGSIGGLIGSTTAAVISLWFVPGAPIWAVVLLGLIVGAVAQLGDFFESMLKRVANVKDSGKIMPGHGGILDRLDGVFFAAPILLIGASFIEKL
jgi:phosphatidate cytidylyltransferase